MCRAFSLGSCGGTNTWLARLPLFPECLFLPWRLDALIKTRKLLKTAPANEILFSAMLRDEK